jgi:hypothetical protein
MPAAAQDPFARPCGFRRIADHADDVVPVPGGPELQVSRRFANAGEMRVRVDEAGYGERTLQIDDTRIRADQPLNLHVWPDRDDGVAGHGDGFDDRPRVVDGDDLSTAQHQIGAAGRRLRCRRHTQQTQNARQTKCCCH